MDLALLSTSPPLKMGGGEESGPEKARIARANGGAT